MPILHIQGIDAEYRDLLPDEEILFKHLEQDEQYFRRPEVPFTDDDIVAIANNEHTYSLLQKNWVDREEWRMDNGVYAMINGELTFIPGSHYGYVCYWTMENGKKPDYRNCTRKIFLLKEYLCFKTSVLAVTRGKSRRKGATSEGTYWEWWICGRKEEKIGGMVSYNNESVQKIFQMLFMRGFRSMLPCFVKEFDSASENFIRFVKPVEKKKRGVPVKREGLNSYIDYQPTTLNSYDSGRVSYLLGDEWGKWDKVDINTYWSKVKPTLTEGDLKVGFAYIPTTVNPKDKGGENYKIFWEAADQGAIDPDTGNPYGINTPSRVVRIFDPATEGYEGCIDKFGESVIDDPSKPILSNKGEWITEGSLTKIKKKRKGLDGLRLMEERRDYPIDVFDMFAFTTGHCEFNEQRLVDRIRYLDDFPVYLRQCRLSDVEKEVEDPLNASRKIKKRIINFMDDKEGALLLYEKPLKENDFREIGGFYTVNSAHVYSVGADTIRIFDAEHGSLCAVCVFKKSIVINGEETGNYPVAMWVGRPRVPSHLYDEIIRLCLWYGCKANIERSAGDYFSEYFHKKGCSDLLLWTPARNPNLPHQRIQVGTESASPFQLQAQLEVAKLYFDGDDPLTYNGNIERVVFPELLEQALEYNHSERTPYDMVVSFMMALIPALKAPNQNIKRGSSMLPTYKLKIPA